MVLFFFFFLILYYIKHIKVYGRFLVLFGFCICFVFVFSTKYHLSFIHF